MKPKPGYIEKNECTTWRLIFSYDDIRAMLVYQFRERGQISDDIPVQCDIEIEDDELVRVVLTAETGQFEKQVFSDSVSE